jgi:hypothetical protein
MTLMTTNDTGTAEEGKAMPVRLRWSPGDIAGMLTVVLAVVGSMLALVGRVVSAEGRIEQTEKAQIATTAQVQAMRDTIGQMREQQARMEAKIDILLGERGGKR